MAIKTLTLSLQESGKLDEKKPTHSGSPHATGLNLSLDQQNFLFDRVEILFQGEKFRIHHTNAAGYTCKRTRAEWLQILPQHEDFLKTLVKNRVVNPQTLYSLTADLPAEKISHQSYTARPDSLPRFEPNPLVSSSGQVPAPAKTSFQSLKKTVEDSPAVAATSKTSQMATMPYSGSTSVTLSRTPAPVRSKSSDPTKTIYASCNQGTYRGPSGLGSNACTAIAMTALPAMIQGKMQTSMEQVMTDGIKAYNEEYLPLYYLEHPHGRHDVQEAIEDAYPPGERLGKTYTDVIKRKQLHRQLLHPAWVAKTKPAILRDMEVIPNTARDPYKTHEVTLVRGEEQEKFEELLLKLQNKCLQTCKIGERIGAALVIANRTIAIAAKKISDTECAYYLFDSHGDDKGGPAFYKPFDSLESLASYLAENNEASDPFDEAASRTRLSRRHKDDELERQISLELSNHNLRNEVGMIMFRAKSS